MFDTLQEAYADYKKTQIEYERHFQLYKLACKKALELFIKKYTKEVSSSTTSKHLWTHDNYRNKALSIAATLDTFLDYMNPKKNPKEYQQLSTLLEKIHRLFFMFTSYTLQEIKEVIEQEMQLPAYIEQYISRYTSEEDDKKKNYYKEM